MIVAATNCIAYEAQVDKNRMYRGMFHHSLLTDGLLRLMAGETLYPETEPDPRYRFEPIDVAQVKVFLWSPFIDQAGYYANLKNWDGTLYPFSDGLTCPKYGIVGKVPLNTVYLWWKELHRVTEAIPKKLMLIYPTDFLTDETPEKKRYKERIVTSTEVAKEIFHDWIMPTVKTPIQSGEWWAHLTVASRQEVLKVIEETCK
jgi:hypothetical protein